MNLNKLFIGGRIGNVQQRTTQSGATMVNISVATNRFQKGKEPVTQWFNCTCFGKTAEFAVNLQKGQEVLVVGGVWSNKGKDKNGNEKEFWNVLVDTIQAAGGKKQDQGQPDVGAQQQPTAASAGVPW